MDSPHDPVILGLDPGTAVTGWGLVQKQGNRYRCLDFGAWRTPADAGRGERLAHLVERLEAQVATRRPDAVAIELAFLGKNIQSALRLGEARGVLLATCARLTLDVTEYPTAVVKKAVVGNGRADKSQVQFMIQRLLGLPSPPTPADASDALAIAFTRAIEGRLVTRSRG